MPRCRTVKRRRQTDFPRVVFFDVTTQNRPRSLGRLKRVQKPEDLRFFTKPQMCTYRQGPKSRARNLWPVESNVLPETHGWIRKHLGSSDLGEKSLKFLSDRYFIARRCIQRV